jgi:2-methylisocitrate lyase-like PEP mutase family enzyme
MQTREELYEVLDYYNFEEKLDEQVIVKKEDK